MKKYILIAGANGAGKSTLFQTFDSLADMPRVNTDEIIRNLGDWKNPNDVLQAGKIAVTKINEYFEQGITFNQETTLCGSSIMQNILRAKSLGYQIEIHYVGVNTVDILKQRIAHRVAEGGHGIPETVIERRYTESFKQLKSIIKLSDMLVLYDNTNIFRRFAVYVNGHLQILADEFPKWYITISQKNG